MKYTIIVIMLATFLVMPGLVRNSIACNYHAVTKSYQQLKKENEKDRNSQFDEEIFILNKIYATY